MKQRHLFFLSSTVMIAILAACASTLRREPAGQASAMGAAAEVFRLHSGRKVLLPKRSENMDYVFLMGSANGDVLDKMLSAEDLVATRDISGRGTIGLIIAKYNSSSIAAYQEVLIVIGAQAKSPQASGVFAGNMAMPGARAPSPYSYFVWQDHVDSALALEMGREVWGLPAGLATIELGTKTSDWTFRLSHKNKGLVFEGKCGNCEIAGKQNTQTVFNLISGYGLRRSLVHVENNGPTLVRPFQASVDALNMKPNTPLADLFKKVAFQPTGWYAGEGLSSGTY